jgi:hypothetical protein
VFHEVIQLADLTILQYKSRMILEKNAVTSSLKYNGAGDSTQIFFTANATDWLFHHNK